MPKNTNFTVVTAIAIFMTICFLCVTYFYVRLQSSYSVLAQKQESVASDSPTSLESSSPSSESLSAPALSNSCYSEIDLLEKKLAAAKTEVLVAGIVNPSRLEDRTTYPISVQKKYVYITFDDGPSQYTPKVLEVLKKNNVKATFFVIYNKNQDYYKQIVADGHTLALHSYTHEYSEIYESVDAFFEDLNKISAYIKSITGVDSKIVRFAGGSSNTISRKYSTGVITKIVSELNRRGYVYYDWNAQCMDATTVDITTEKILENITSFTYIDGEEKPYIMLLLHNGDNGSITAEALQSIIDYYKGLGYTFEKIDETTPVVHQPVQN